MFFLVRLFKQVTRRTHINRSINAAMLPQAVFGFYFRTRDYHVWSSTNPQKYGKITPWEVVCTIDTLYIRNRVSMCVPSSVGSG